MDLATALSGSAAFESCPRGCWGRRAQTTHDVKGGGRFNAFVHNNTECRRHSALLRTIAGAVRFLAKFLHVRRSELDRTLQVAGFAMVLGWAMYTAFNGAQAIFLTKSGPQAYPLFFIILALAVWPMVALQGA